MLHSIGTRIFLGMALATVSFLALSLWVIDAMVVRFVEQEITQDLVRSGDTVERFEHMRSALLVDAAWSVAQAPHLRAALGTSTVDRETVFHTAQSLADGADVPLLLVLDARGELLANASSAEARPESFLDQPGVEQALRGNEFTALWTTGGELFSVAGVPVDVGGAVAGVLCLGSPLDNEVASEIRTMTGYDVAVLRGTRVMAYSWEARGGANKASGERHLPDEWVASLTEAGGRQTATIRAGGSEYLVSVRPFSDEGTSIALSRPLTEALSYSRGVKQLLLWVGLAVGALGLFLSRLTARQISRPIGESTLR